MLIDIQDIFEFHECGFRIKQIQLVNTSLESVENYRTWEYVRQLFIIIIF